LSFGSRAGFISSVIRREEDLLDAPITDFYDASRDVGLLKVESETYRLIRKWLQQRQPSCD
jgi:hypothetical protein